MAAPTLEFGAKAPRGRACTACSGDGWFYSTGWPGYHKATCPVCKGSGRTER